MRWHHLLFGLVFVVPFFHQAFGQQGPAEPPRAGREFLVKSRAAGYVRVDTDPASALRELIFQDLVEIPIAVAVVEVSGDVAKSKNFRTSSGRPTPFTYPSPASMVLSVEVDSADEDVPAAKVIEKSLELYRQRLEMLDQQEQVPDRERLKVLDQLVDRAFGEMMEAKKSLEVNAALHKVPVDEKAAAERLEQLNASIASLDNEVSDFKSQAEILRKHIADLAQEPIDGQDPVVTELAKANDFRKQAVQIARESLGEGPASKRDFLSRRQALLAAEAELAEHEAQLAKTRRESRQGTRLEELRRKLEELALNAELAQRRLGIAQASLPQVTFDLQLARLKAERLEADYRAIAAERDQLDRKLRLHRKPSVALLDPAALPEAAGKAPETASPPAEKPK